MSKKRVGQTAAFEPKTVEGAALVKPVGDGERAALARQIGPQPMELALAATQEQTLTRIQADAEIAQLIDAAEQTHERVKVGIATNLVRGVRRIEERVQ